MKRLLLLLLAAIALPVHADPLQDRLKALHPRWYDAERDTWRAAQSRPPQHKPPPDLNLPHGPDLPVTALAWILAIAALGVLAWLVVQSLPRDALPALPQKDTPRTPRETRAVALEREADEPDDPEQALQAAKRAQNWPRAVVWLYAILLLGLDDAGAIRLRRGATNRRYRLEVAAWRRPNLELLQAVDAAIAAFERVYFGHGAADRALVEALEAQIRGALRSLPTEETP